MSLRGLLGLHLWLRLIRLLLGLLRLLLRLLRLLLLELLVALIFLVVLLLLLLALLRVRPGIHGALDCACAGGRVGNERIVIALVDDFPG